MSKRAFTLEEMELLSKNENVSKCGKSAFSASEHLI